MEEIYAKKVIEMIMQNPQINYQELAINFPDSEDGQLFRLLYALREKEIISTEEIEEMKFQGLRGIEMSKFSLMNNRNLNKKLHEAFLFWKL